MVNNANFKGIFVPVITPFTPQGEIYEQGLLNILAYLQANNISGVWLLGSYGSFPLLSEKERMQLAGRGLARARELGLTVIVNVGSLSTDMAVRLAKHAQEHGAHALASVAPFYYAANNYREKNFLEYFQTLLNSVQLPVFFYNNQKATGFKPDLEFFQKLLDLGIQGFKSKGDYLEMSAQINLLKKHSPQAVYLSGTTSVHLQGHLLGADGVTSGVALAMPELVTSLQKALDNHSIDKAVQFQDLVLQARTIAGRHVSRAMACYDILESKGIDAGTCRSPWLRMEPAQARKTVRELRAIQEAV